MNYNKLGMKIRQERLKRDFTQEQLSELCGISSSYIGIIERGDKKLSIETLVKIATILDVSIDYLLSDSLQLSADTRIQQISSIVSNLESNDINMIIDVVSTMASHLTKQ